MGPPLRTIRNHSRFAGGKFDRRKEGMVKKRANSRARKITKYSENFSLRQTYLGRILMLGGIFVCVTAAFFYGVRYFFYNNVTFNIKEISVNMESEYSFDEDLDKLNEFYIGRNIFTVDLKQIQVLMRKNFPQFKKIEIRRNFPNVLEVDIVPRETAAVIDSGDGVLIDSEGVVLAIGESPRGIVKIKGMNFFLKMPEKGDRIKNEALIRALLFLRGLSKKGDIDKKNIDFIDIHDRNNIQISISGVIVKVGKDDFLRKIDSLKEILNDPELNVKDLKYIDLRFEDAVISFR